MKNKHVVYTLDSAKKIIDALEVLGKDYELKRINKRNVSLVADKEKHELWSPDRIEYVITEL